jgi:hypothetical protein
MGQASRWASQPRTLPLMAVDERSERDPAGRMGPNRAIEAWWGEQLDDALMIRISRASDDYLVEFREFYDDGEHYILPSRGPGILRPRVLSFGDPQGRDSIGLALSSLLYAHEVIVDDPLYTALKKGILWTEQSCAEPFGALRRCERWRWRMWSSSSSRPLGFGARQGIHHSPISSYCQGRRGW